MKFLIVVFAAILSPMVKATECGCAMCPRKSCGLGLIVSMWISNMPPPSSHSNDSRSKLCLSYSLLSVMPYWLYLQVPPFEVFVVVHTNLWHLHQVILLVKGSRWLYDNRRNIYSSFWSGNQCRLPNELLGKLM